MTGYHQNGNGQIHPNSNAAAAVNSYLNNQTSCSEQMSGLEMDSTRSLRTHIPIIIVLDILNKTKREDDLAD
jgi:hypothetical protein